MTKEREVSARSGMMIEISVKGEEALGFVIPEPPEVSMPRKVVS
jgi:hypothetical protein